MLSETKGKWEYGDFQTPPELAEAALQTLRKISPSLQSVIEPTCGRGAFLLEAINVFPDVSNIVGVDINEQYLSELNERIVKLHDPRRIRLIHGDFFFLNWSKILHSLPQPILIVGNPPWVTSAELGSLQSANVPMKSNFQARRGYDAITGKSNFDISEWMLLQHLEWLKERCGMIAILCKTAVARKVLFHAWKHNFPVGSAKLFLIDAQKHFGASVDACFLIIDMLSGGRVTDCDIYVDLRANHAARAFGYHDGLVLSDVALYRQWKHLRGTDQAYTWRSGIKHDCSKVMEFELIERKYRNGAGEFTSLENDYVYPMLKSSDVGNGQVRYGRKYMLVTQKYVGEDTSAIKRKAPRTWRYLESHEIQLSERASSIYRNRPKFSVFGVGDYSFSPWKVAVSGFYKRLSFQVIGPYQNKTVVLDDTIYFLPCWSEQEARFLHGLLTSAPAEQFYESMIFWPDKRPITIEILKRLDLQSLSVQLGCNAEYVNFARRRRDLQHEESRGQLSFGIAEKEAIYRRKSAPNKSLLRTRRKTARS